MSRKSTFTMLPNKPDTSRPLRIQSLLLPTSIFKSMTLQIRKITHIINRDSVPTHHRLLPRLPTRQIRKPPSRPNNLIHSPSLSTPLRSNPAITLLLPLFSPKPDAPPPTSGRSIFPENYPHTILHRRTYHRLRDRSFRLHLRLRILLTNPRLRG